VDSSVHKHTADEGVVDVDIESAEVKEISSIELGVAPLPHVLVAGKNLTKWVFTIMSVFIVCWLSAFLYIENNKSHEIKMIKGQYNKLIINSDNSVN